MVQVPGLVVFAVAPCAVSSNAPVPSTTSLLRGEGTAAIVAVQGDGVGGDPGRVTGQGAGFAGVGTAEKAMPASIPERTTPCPLIVSFELPAEILL